MEVGTDTYILLADAETYLANNYLSTSEYLTAWNALLDADKQVLLNRALKIIENQIFAGIKDLESQPLQFPRWLYSDFESMIPQGINTKPYFYTGIPANLGYAQAEIAISQTIADNRVEMQRSGVKSYTIGHLSESFGTGMRTDSKLGSIEAFELLRPYLSGAVRIV